MKNVVLTQRKRSISRSKSLPRKRSKTACLTEAAVQAVAGEQITNAGLQDNLERRAAIHLSNPTMATSQNRMGDDNPDTPLPSCAKVGQGNFLMANWAIGREADWREVGETL